MHKKGKGFLYVSKQPFLPWLLYPGWHRLMMANRDAADLLVALNLRSALTGNGGLGESTIKCPFVANSQECIRGGKQCDSYLIGFKP